MLPSEVGDDACSLARRWVLDLALAKALVSLNRWASDRFASAGIRWAGLWVVSGFRTRAHQAQLNPDAPDSLHTRCPSLAVDLRMGASPPLGDLTPIWQLLGARWKLLGGRWGGDFSQADNNHFDLGVGVPRQGVPS